ncbi:MAG TPA: type II toxin-antitoxin system VapC family toxin [Methylocystis sp.]|nr:type II toxin-antitoxin system VapC family toxin [Methylocystis sp.]
MFVDSSAIVAILLGEPEADALAGALEQASRRVTSPLVRLEATIILSARLDIEPSAAQQLFDEFLQEAAIEVVPLTDAIGRRAVECFERFGKGRHPARLNLADCFSYACAREHRDELLFKGEDFASTDVNG